MTKRCLQHEEFFLIYILPFARRHAVACSSRLLFLFLFFFYLSTVSWLSANCLLVPEVLENEALCQTFYKGSMPTLLFVSCENFEMEHNGFGLRGLQRLCSVCGEETDIGPLLFAPFGNLLDTVDQCFLSDETLGKV